ncbi:MAG: serine/threonine protein kinase [Myxococcales bacterium]|nr:serine/threonine protein kinase [Myxococcales bacterium]
MTAAAVVDVVNNVADKFGSYVIHEELGAGGLATVHLADSPAIKSKVALKRLYPHIANVTELVASFIDEARLARYLRHPNIARVYEFGRIRGSYFIAFEFVPGPTVQQLQRQCAEHVGAIPIPVVLEIACQLCEALDHAHNLRDETGQPLGIVHRDVSPSNLIVSNTGLVKLIDFGLAKTKQSSVQSQAGVIKGKLSYVAPEYLRGKLDARCDLWAVGVVLHELLTGRRLFDAPDDFITLERVRLMAIPPPSRINPDVPSELDAIVLTALDRDPAHRWQTAAEMRTALVTLAKTRSLTKPQFVAWTEWAFSQKQRLREDSGLSALHEIIDSGQIEEIRELPASSEAMVERRRESVAMMPPVGAAMLHRRAGNKSLWMVLVAIVVAGIIAAARYGTF